MSDPNVWHALHRLADYPVLAELARSSGTEATKLDGRACLHLYQDGSGDIDWLTVSAAERDFMRRLGLFSICPCCGVRGLVRETRDHQVTSSDGQPVTVKALTGDYCDACGEVLLDGDRRSARHGCVATEGDQMILFLDFDGVLHPHPNDGTRFFNAPRVWELLARHPEVSIVFSTGWRFEHTLAALRQFATQQGGEHLADRFIDATPLLRHDADAGSRERDCRAWLTANRQAGPWLALDDMPSLFEPGSPNLYPVNAKRGLMHYDVERISVLIERTLR